MTHDPTAIVRATLEVAKKALAEVEKRGDRDYRFRLGGYSNGIMACETAILAIDPSTVLSKLEAQQDRYGRVKISTIQKAKADLRRAIQSEGTETIQALWDRLEQWIDSPPMMPAQQGEPWQPPEDRNEDYSCFGWYGHAWHQIWWDLEFGPTWVDDDSCTVNPTAFWPLPPTPTPTERRGDDEGEA